MMDRLPVNEWIGHLPELRAALKGLAEDAVLVENACESNPWFTPFYIQTSIERLLDWFVEEEILRFYESEGPFEGPAKRVGIIMAGNLPLVGFQDLFHTLLSGNIAVVKPASKDKVLMTALVNRWVEAVPMFEGFLQVVDSLEKIDFLLATGGNNTARLLDHKFRTVPRLLRKHRFSAARLTGEESKPQLAQLCEDILLYNGMGCRNVSLLLTPPDWNPGPLLEALNQWPKEKLSQPYLELLEWERARLGMLGADLLPCETILLNKVEEVAVPSVGLLNWLPVEEPAMDAVLAQLQGQLQCLVSDGDAVAFGETQCPRLDDYADGENVMQRLKNL